jgi:hypothetical protein
MAMPNGKRACPYPASFPDFLLLQQMLLYKTCGGMQTRASGTIKNSLEPAARPENLPQAP